MRFVLHLPDLNAPGSLNPKPDDMMEAKLLLYLQHAFRPSNDL